MKYTSKKYSILLVLFLAACVQQPQMVWDNPNPKKHDFEKERYECLKEANNDAPAAVANTTDMFGDPASYDMNSDNRNNLMIACMKTHGWNLVPVTQVKPQKDQGGG